MARFYGTVQGGASKTEVTRSGHQSLRVTAQSYNGDVVVCFVKTNGSDDIVQIYVRDHTGRGPNGGSERNKLLYAGPMSKLLDQSERATMLRALASEELAEG